MIVRILKAFSGSNGDYMTGQVVDLEGRNLAKLIEHRYCEPTTEAPREPTVARNEPQKAKPKTPTRPGRKAGPLVPSAPLHS